MAVESALLFLRALTQRRTAPAVTVIGGPQAFLREYVLDCLRQVLKSADFRELGLQIGLGDSYNRIVSELEGADLFAPKRLVTGRILRSYRERGGNTDTEPSGRIPSPERGAEAALLNAIRRLGTNVRLALLFERDTVPAGIRRAVESSGTLVNCMRPFDNQLGQYAAIFATNLGLKPSTRTVERLVARYGSDLAAIANALAKAASLHDDSEQVEATSGAGPIHIPELFEIAEALVRKSAAEIVALVDHAIQLGRDPIDLLAVELIPQIRRMLLAATLLEQGNSMGQIAAVVGGAPSSPLIARALDGARRYGLEALLRAHRRACELDASFKMGLVKEREQALSALLLELLDSSKTDRRPFGASS